MEDLSHLGGPMGTEYTTPIGTELFKNEQDAINFLKKESKGQLDELTKLKKSQYFDCRWIGFNITHEIIK